MSQKECPRFTLTLGKATLNITGEKRDKSSLHGIECPLIAGKSSATSAKGVHLKQ
ncbi:MAG: hypothetical protein U9N61_03960 [Euryarchaeota archaeon]|nr:hypothetical protein [Euryarchaeota archaeon]